MYLSICENFLPFYFPPFYRLHSHGNVSIFLPGNDQEQEQGEEEKEEETIFSTIFPRIRQLGFRLDSILFQPANIDRSSSNDRFIARQRRYDTSADDTDTILRIERSILRGRTYVERSSPSFLDLDGSTNLDTYYWNLDTYRSSAIGSSWSS